MLSGILGLILALGWWASQESIVREVVFEGETRLSPENLRTQLRTKVGSPFSWIDADLDSKSLYERFAVIANCRIETLEPDGVRVTFQLVEPDAIRKVEFEGNDKLDDEELAEALGLSLRGVIPRGLTGPGPLLWLVGRLEERYEEEGYLYSEIQASLEERRNEELVLVFRILEGPKVRVDDIEFRGLSFFKPGHLHDLMETKESFLFFRHTFKKKALERDLARLEEFFRDEGFLDAQVSLEELIPSKNYRKVTLVLRVEQGPRYTVGSIALEGLQAFSEDEIRPLIELKRGQPYRTNAFRRDQKRILDYYGKRGYIRADLGDRPEESHRLDAPIVDLTYRVREDVAKRIRDIRIVGNHGTWDEVIRRELFFYPGELFDLEEIAYSQDRLRASRLFLGPDQLPDVFIRNEPTEDPDYEDVVIEVEEGQTGFMNFLGGIGSGSGVFFGISIEKENFDLTDLPSSPWSFFEEFFDQEAFHGAGQRLRLRANPGSRFSNYLVSFTEPSLLGPLERPVSLTTTGYFRESLLRLYDEDRVGASVSIGKGITRDSGVSLGVRQERIEISNPAEDVPDVVSQDGGHSTRALTGGGWFRALDSIRNPTDGFLLNADAELLGGPFGGDVDAVKFVLSGEYFYPLYENEEGQRHVLEIKGSMGWANEYDETEEIPFFERFRVGGISRPFTLRGFDFWGVGPHQSDEPVGGTGTVVINTNYVFPIYETYDARLREHIPVLRGILFFDQGSLESDFEDLPDGTWRMAAGVGIRFRIPIPLLAAPLEVYYGVPLNRSRTDERESFTINFSTRF